jgi:hypothetical protein
MTRTERHKRLLLAAALILPLSACARRELVPPAEEVIEVGTPTGFLTCAPTSPQPRPDTQTIGAAGGRLQSGGNELTIPASALSGNQRLIFRQQPGERVGVEVDQSVRFATGRSAMLNIDIGRCDSDALAGAEWFVWRMHENQGQSQKLRTRIAGARATANIDSTSAFMIAN